jgi:hypothetical protein
MAVMTVTAPLAHRVWDDPRIRMPDAEVWSRLDEDAQDRVMDAIEAVFDEHHEAMSEGVRHSTRKTGIADDLDAHVRRAGGYERTWVKIVARRSVERPTR